MGSNNVILKTLLYSDIFDYPLRKQEVWYYLISDKKLSIDSIGSGLKKIKIIDSKNDFYFLKGRKAIVSIRERKEKISLGKFKKAEMIIKRLSLIPTIRFIGISGNLALNNADKEDDIDLFIITKKNTIWLTRLVVVLVLSILGAYRKRSDKHVKDKICTNMFLDESALIFSKNRRDLFTAHEITQVRPVINKRTTYEQLILANRWIEGYLPNAFTNLTKKIVKREGRKIESSEFLKIIDYIVKIPQVLYMRKHKTREEISDKILAFHPQNHKDYVLNDYLKRLRKYNL